MSKEPLYVNDIEKAVNKTLEMDITLANGMQTGKVISELEKCYVHFIRKSVSPDHPEGLFIKVIPKNGMGIEHIELSEISHRVLTSMGYTTDLTIDFTEEPISRAFVELN